MEVRWKVIVGELLGLRSKLYTLHYLLFTNSQDVQNECDIFWKKLATEEYEPDEINVIVTKEKHRLEKNNISRLYKI